MTWGSAWWPTRRSAEASSPGRSARSRTCPRTTGAANPRFQEDALRENLELADRVTELARAQGVTPAQLALAWVMAKGEDIVPIPGTKSPGRVEENAAATDVKLSAEDVQELDSAISPETVRGSRYAEAMMGVLNN